MAKQAVFTGSLDFLGLPDLLQFLGTNGSTGVLRLTNPFSNETGLVFLKKGKPVNASNGSLDGLEALYSLFGWTTGEFKFSQEKIRGKKSIHKSQMEIILDGLRMLDEGVIKKIAPDSLKKGKSGPLDSDFKLPLITKSIPNYFLVVGEDRFQEGACPRGGPVLAWHLHPRGSVARHGEAAGWVEFLRLTLLCMAKF